MTAPFSDAFEASLKDLIQNCKFTMRSGFVVNPQWHCCISGTSVGVDKDPVAVVVTRPVNVCAGAAVTVDYSMSYSPTSTINTWQVDWGDGQISNGAWPGAGTVNHPLGGYVLPGIYTITLTVTDLLGATGIDTQQINVIDCTAAPGVVLLGACGSSGAHYSVDGGLNWDSYGLDGVEIYDLKTSLFTQAIVDPIAGSVSLSNIIAWAATVDGLYFSPGDGQWERWELPEPAIGLGEPDVVAVSPSKASVEEVYVLARTPVSDRTWLYHYTGLRGLWEWLELEAEGGSIAPVLESAGGVDNYDAGRKLIGHTSVNTTAWAIDSGGNGFRYRDNAQTWHGYPEAGEDLNSNIDIGTRSYELFTCGDGGAIACDESVIIPSLTRFWGAIPYNGGADILPMPLICCHGIPAIGGTHDGFFVESTQIWYVDMVDDWPLPCSWYAYTGMPATALWGCPWALPGGSGDPKFVGPNHPGATACPGGMVTVNIFWLTTSTKIYKCSFCREDSVPVPGEDTFHITFTEEWAGAPPPGDAIFEYDGGYYVARDTTKLLKYNGAGGWADDTVECAESITCAHAWSDDYSIAIGTATGIYTLQGGEYVKISELANVERVACIIEGGSHIVLALTTAGISRVDLGSAPSTAVYAPGTGHKHIIDTPVDNAYVYVALLKREDDTPIVFRVNADFSLGEVTTISEPGVGSWAGVACDYYDIARVWVFGDLGAEKVLVSDDDGDTLTDVTDAGWGANELVRPLLVSLYSVDDAIVILNTALETWRTGDSGLYWEQSGAVATPWDAQCGVRDYIDDQIIYIGRLVQNVDNAQSSINQGYNWADRSLPINAEVTGLEIVG